MANVYCSISQLENYIDERQLAQLSNDTNSDTRNDTKVQALLDAEASELDGILTGRFPLPLTTVPAVLTKWVAVRVIKRLYSRRQDLPGDVKEDFAWSEEWRDLLLARKISIPNMTQPQPVLYSSEDMAGKSITDNVRYFDRRPSDTSTSKGQ